MKADLILYGLIIGLAVNLYLGLFKTSDSGIIQYFNDTINEDYYGIPLTYSTQRFYYSGDHIFRVQYLSPLFFLFDWLTLSSISLITLVFFFHEETVKVNIKNNVMQIKEGSETFVVEVCRNADGSIWGVYPDRKQQVGDTMLYPNAVRNLLLLFSEGAIELEDFPREQVKA